MSIDTKFPPARRIQSRLNLYLCRKALPAGPGKNPCSRCADRLYDRELIVSEVKEENELFEDDTEGCFYEWSSEDGECGICPWCGKKIEYNEENNL